ncbi:MAG: FtsX-like permease family protein [Acidobacteriota bacterium]|nr:FtsX-like permease family protein [Acidobacteriota bacterium]
MARLTVWAAIVGIAFGTAAIIAALALSNGFRQAIEEKILANMPHVTIFRADGNEISNWKELNERIKQIEGVKKISAQSFDNALLIGKTNSAFAVLRSSEEKSQISNLKSETTNREQRTADKILIELGSVLAERTGLKMGDTAEIVSGSGQINENFAPVSTDVEVARIFETGLYEYDLTWVRLSLKDAARMTGKAPSSASTIAVETANIFDSNETAKRISEQIGAEYKVLDWQEANRPLFAALELERQIALLIIGLIIFAAALNITTTLALSVSERRFDIAVLRACGASAKKIISIFLIEGLILASVGLIAGILLGIAICFLINQFDLIHLPADVYEVTDISLRINPGEVLMVAILVLFLCLLASAIPARAAARMRPAENLKN